jgi:hypothetical protein
MLTLKEDADVERGSIQGHDWRFKSRSISQRETSSCRAVVATPGVAAISDNHLPRNIQSAAVVQVTIVHPVARQMSIKTKSIHLSI